MATYSSNSMGALKLECPAEVFFQRFTRKTQRLCYFFSDVDLKFHLGFKDERTRTIIMNLKGNLITQDHKSVKVTFTVTPGEQSGRSYLDFVFEFEKIRNDIQDSRIIEPVLSHIQLKAFSYHSCSKQRSIEVNRTATSCFLQFDNALKANDLLRHVPSPASDLKNQILKIEFLGPEVDEKFYKVTATVAITPQKRETNHCLVKWHIDAEKKLSGSSRGVADIVYSTIQDLLNGIDWTEYVSG